MQEKPNNNTSKHIANLDFIEDRLDILDTIREIVQIEIEKELAKIGKSKRRMLKTENEKNNNNI